MNSDGNTAALSPIEDNAFPKTLLANELQTQINPFFAGRVLVVETRR